MMVLKAELLLLTILVGVFTVTPVSADDLHRGPKPLPCTGGYGVLEATNALVDLDANQGCNFLNGEVPLIENECAKLLQQGPCAAGEWLIIDEDEGTIQCEKKPCPEGYVFYDDHCVSLNDTSGCDETLELIINVNGRGECECKPGRLFHPETERCFIPYTQGPCKKGQIIKMKINGKKVGYGKCERNPCPFEKMTFLDRRCLPMDRVSSSVHCYTIGKRFPCRAGSYLLIESSLAQPYCLNQKPNSIISRTQRGMVKVTKLKECDVDDYDSKDKKCKNGYMPLTTKDNRRVCYKGKCKKN